MNIRLLLPLLPLLALAAPPTPQQKAQWFPPKDMMTIGVYYYPEAWSETQWARDIGNIKKHGFEFIHMGEFAWSFMEPEEGKYDFGWLDRNVELAARQGLKVVLCTPSATPPAWLVRKHPEVLMVKANGLRMDHGSREHADWSSPVYREYVRKINTQLAQRYGSNPAVWGWQIDNELSHYGSGFSYTPAARASFIAWLKERYGTIQKLNTDWGNAFWSQRYNSWDQIEMPNQELLPGGVNQHALLDLQRWYAAEAADYIRDQAQTIRKYSKNQWITTNYMAMFKEMVPALSQDDLDVMTWTIYPVNGPLGMGEDGYRLGSPYEMSFMHDYMRNFSGLSGQMELQPGQVNWGSVNTWPYPGAIHMWLIRAFGAGASLACTYRYRQPLYGNEQYHKGVVETDGVTLSPGGREWVQAIEDMKKFRAAYTPNAKPPAEYWARRTAFLNSFDNRWDIDNHTQTVRWNTTGHWMKFYRALKSINAPVDVLPEEKDWSQYPFLVAPAYQLVDAQLIERFRKYAENGGTLILTARSGQKDRRGWLWEAQWAEPIYSLIGARIPYYDVLPPGRDANVRYEGTDYKWGIWGDGLVPDAGTETLAVYSDKFLKGKAAATIRKLGKGTVAYIGVETNDGILEDSLMRLIYQRAGVKPANLPLRFVVDWRDGFWVATNFSDNPVDAPAPAGTKFLSGSKTVPPGGVAVWHE